MKAKLRVCASCEWIFKNSPTVEKEGCPKCGFAHYGARHVYADRCYRYAKTQEPWIRRKVADYEGYLFEEVAKGE